jgi:hypothetical protein
MKQHTDNNNEPHLTQGKVQGINNYLPSLYKKKDRFSWSLLWISLAHKKIFLTQLQLFFLLF